VTQSKIKNLIFIVIVSVILTLLAFYNYLKKQHSKNIPTTEVKILERDLDVIYGKDSSNLTIIMYSSYNCTFCRRFFKDVYPQIKINYIDSSKVKFVVKFLELSNDKYVIKSLKTAICINKYGNFEKLNELLLIDPKVVYTQEFDAVVEDFIGKDSFVAECMLGGDADNYLKENLKEFKSIGLTGTPTFIINNNIYKGFRDYENFKKVIEKELSNPL